MRGEFLDINGARLYYYAAGTRGAGEPIVLLHGFPTSGHLWNEVVPLLPAGHRVVVLDLLGFGRSDPPSFGRNAVDLRSHADRLIAVLDYLRIDVACLAGHDVGGAIAQSVAVRQPKRVSRLALVNSAAFDAWPPSTVKLARAAIPVIRHLPPSWILFFARAIMLRGYTDHERGARDVDLFLRPFGDRDGRGALMTHLRALECSETEALAPRLKDVACPTSIVWGARDPFLEVEVGERLRAAIPASTLDVIPRGRHYLPLEEPHRIAGAIQSLLRR
jgi:pimeloyl-ACP methyl ester carboxylesterase